MSCVDCKAARHWARSCGCSRARALLRLCWAHEMRARGALHIIARASGTFAVVVVVALGLLGLVNKIAWDLRGLVAR